MASAQVTLKVSPHELQIIKAALHMYAYVSGNIGREGYDHPLCGYQQDLSICKNDPRRAKMLAAAILQDIGLK